VSPGVVVRAVAAALLAGAAVALAASERGLRRLRALRGIGAAAERPHGRRLSAWWEAARRSGARLLPGRLREAVAGDPALVRACCAVPLGALAGWLLSSPVPLIGGAVAVPPLRRLLRGRRAAARRERARHAVGELCAAVAGELRAGATPEQALLMALPADEEDRFPEDLRSGRRELVAAAGYGGDVPTALRRLAQVPGGEGAAAVAACWELAEQRGTGLAAGLDRIAESLRAERALRESLRAELAAPRSTAALLAGLPVFGVGLGSALGARPFRFLLHTGPGLGCLVAGAALEWAGLAWTGRLAATAEAAGALAGAGNEAASARASPPVVNGVPALGASPARNGG